MTDTEGAREKATAPAGAGGRRKKPKSRFAALRDRPKRATEYEELIFGLYWPEPYYVPIWREDSTVLRINDWRGFRDPAKFTYHTWVLQRDEEASQFCGLLAAHDRASAFAAIDPRWLSVLRGVLPGLRFSEAAVCMSMHEVKSEALGEYVSYAFSLLAFDKLGHVQSNVDLCDLYDRHVGGFADARAAWDDGPAYQPLRRVVERLMNRRDWAELIVSFGLAYQGTLAPLVYEILPELGVRFGDPVLAAASTMLAAQSRRHLELTEAFCRYVFEVDPEGGETVRRWLGTALPPCRAAGRAFLDAALRPLGSDAPPSDGLMATLIAGQDRRLEALGLVPGPSAPDMSA